MERRHPPPSSSFSSSSNLRNSDDLFTSFFGGAGTPPPSSSYIPNPRNYDGEFFGFGSLLVRNPPATETVFPCSLEDLYKGGQKKITITRNVFDSSRQLQTITEILTIEIKPGWKKGTKITFVEKGEQELGSKIADRVIIIDEKRHKVFTRDGNDLIIKQKIPLLEALIGKTIELTTLDGRNLMIPVTEIVKPGYELIVPNEGMPNQKEPMKKGNLVIKFDVEYPTLLNTKQKYLLGRALAGNP